MNIQRWLPKRKSVILTWLLSYILVLFVPIIVSLAVYTETKRIVESQVERGNEGLLKQMQEAIDYQIASVKRLSEQIYSNVKVQDLLYSNKFSRGDYQYELYGITQDLKAYQPAYTNFDSFYVYWAPGDVALMPGLYRSGEFLFGEMYRGGNLTLEQWKEQVRSTDLRQIVLTSRKTPDGGERRFINFIQSLPVDNRENPAGSVVTMIDAGELLRTAADISKFNGGNVIILNERNQVLVSEKPLQRDIPHMDRLTGGIGSFNAQYDGEISQYSYIKSQNSGLTYLTVSPMSVVWKEAVYVRNLSFLSMAVSLIGGILLTIVFLWRNYKPVDRLLKEIMQQSGGVMEPEVNEFHFIQNTLSRTFDEKEKIRLRMKQQQIHLRGNFLARLLKGKPDDYIPHSEAISSYRMQFVSDQFCVMLFYIEDSEKFFERMEGLQTTNPEKLLHFIVMNITEELINREHAGWMAEVDDMLALLVNIKPKDSGSASDDLVRIAEEAMLILKSHYEIRLTVAVSGIHDSISGISAAYKEALDAMEYKLVMGIREIIVYDQLRFETMSLFKEGYYYPLQVEQQMMNWIKVGDVEKARNALDDIFERNFSRVMLPVELTRCLMFDLVSTFVKTIQEIGDVQESFLAGHPRIIEELTASDTVSDMRSSLEDMLTEVCRYTSAKQESNKMKLRNEGLLEQAQKVIHFIEQNYTDYNLSVSMIGDHFGMKSTYLSKLFKEQTGESMLDYINKVRIDRAKQLLLQEKAPVQDAAGRCGFSDLNTFMRTFKKLEGITPGQFKMLD